MAKDADRFARDLGYLDKFLLSLRGHAATLAEPAASRLGTLLGEQDQAWAEIRALLAGEPPSAIAGVESDAETPDPAPAAEPARRLTVGSLMG